MSGEGEAGGGGEGGEGGRGGEDGTGNAVRGAADGTGKSGRGAAGGTRDDGRGAADGTRKGVRGEADGGRGAADGTGNGGRGAAAGTRDEGRGAADGTRDGGRGAADGTRDDGHTAADGTRGSGRGAADATRDGTGGSRRGAAGGTHEGGRDAADATRDGREGSADERLLSLLRSDAFVSGEHIAAELGVSRAAVGKRVEVLRKRGYAIAAVPKRGYRLDGVPDLLDAGAVASRLTTAWVGRAWRHVASIGSTNDEAAAWARAGAPAGAVVVADEQTRGRGRLGRRWHSPPGESLYYSVVLRPPLPPHRVPPLTLAAGVAVAEALVGLDVTPQLKWPNDVLVDGKKVAGILTEMSADIDHVHHVVVGIGVNLNTTAFPEELVAIATSAALARGATVGRADFAAALSARLEHWVDRFVSEGTAAVTAAWKQHARFFGRRVRVSAGRDVLEGVAEDLDDDGALRLRLDDGRVTRVVAGEVVPLG